METTQIILISVIVFLLVAVVLFVITSVGGSGKQKKLDVIRGGAGGDGGVNEKDLQHKRRAEIAKKLKNSRDEDKQKDPSKVSIAVKLQQAGSKFTSFHFWAFSAVFGVVFAGGAFAAGLELMVVGMLFVTGFFGVPRFILRQAIKRRQKKFLEEFADALDAVVRLLKAGMPVSEAVSMISREFEGPVGEEMSIIYDKQKIGVPLHEAAAEGCKRMPLPEMKMFAAGLAIQAQTGSSLSEVLMNLSNVIRARFRLKRKIMALSSEAIASASIIGCLPLVVALGLWTVNPEYLEPLFTTDGGKKLVMGALFWMSLGVLVMKQMINFKI